MSKQNVVNAVLVVLSALLIVARAVCENDLLPYSDDENGKEV